MLPPDQRFSMCCAKQADRAGGFFGGNSHAVVGAVEKEAAGNLFGFDDAVPDRRNLGAQLNESLPANGASVFL